MEDSQSKSNAEYAQGSHLLCRRPGKGELPFLRQGTLPKGKPIRTVLSRTVLSTIKMVLHVVATRQLGERNGVKYCVALDRFGPVISSEE